MIAVVGDWDADEGFAWRALYSIAARGITKVLHVGDAGIGFGGGFRLRPDGSAWAFEDDLSDMASELGIDVWITPGNHENYDTIDAAPREDDGRIILAPHVWAMPRGFRWEEDGWAFGSLGGAYSIDKERRTPGRSWWPQETISPADVHALGDDPLDVLITHDVPAGVKMYPRFTIAAEHQRASEFQRYLLAQAVHNTQPEIVVSGHWHTRISARMDSGRTTAHVLGDNHGTVTDNVAIIDTRTLTMQTLEGIR